MILILVFAFRGSAFDNQSSAPIPPPPAGSAGVKDPYVHLLESQSAMSMLMMQMAREMNQRSLQQQLPQQQQQEVGQDPNQPQARTIFLPPSGAWPRQGHPKALLPPYDQRSVPMITWARAC